MIAALSIMAGGVNTGDEARFPVRGIGGPGRYAADGSRGLTWHSAVMAGGGENMMQRCNNGAARLVARFGVGCEVVGVGQYGVDLPLFGTGAGDATSIRSV